MEAPARERKMGFARKLASPNKKTREKAISLLVLWLTSQKQIEENELKKIWKGLFYCVWHSDKVPVQADLIERLASVPEKLDTSLSLQFFKVFLVTMRREWAGIDRLRLDKFYLLLRRYLIHMLVVLESSGWDADLIKEFMSTLLERAFLAKDQYAALGINLHYVDIFLQELERFLPLRADTFKLLLEPFLVVSANASDKCLLQRIRENIFGRLLDLGHTVITAKQEGNPLESSIESLGSMALSLQLGLEAFRLASMPSTSQENRKLLYELHKEYETLEKLLNTSGVALSLVVCAKKKKRKKKALDQICSIDKPRKGEMKQKRAIKALGKKATGCPAGDMKATDNLDTVIGTGEGLSALLGIPSEGTLSVENKAGEGKVKLSKRKVSERQTNLVLQSKQQEVSDGKRKKAKQKSSEKVEKVALHEGTGVEKEHYDLAEDCRLELQSNADGLSMDDAVVSNLKKQFDSLAEEQIESEMCLSSVVSNSVALSRLYTGSKKRKRVVLIDAIDDLKGKEEALLPEVNGGKINGSTSVTGGLNGNSSGKVKRVRFALKKNLVWTPSSPLPPESVRVPPSATPRGSALKKGVPPGPIISAANGMALKQRKGVPRRPSSQSNMNKNKNKNRRGVPNRSKAFAKRRRSI